MAKTALITGINGQDGAYLARFLLRRGYRVVGAFRGGDVSEDGRLRELAIAGAIERVEFDLRDAAGIERTVAAVMPDEVYNLAAQSHVGASFGQAVLTAEVNALGPARLLDALRRAGGGARFFQASSAEMFGRTDGRPQDEACPFRPRSPYGAAKLHAHWMTVQHREHHGLHASSGILFNHESPLRGLDFVTRKITHHLALVREGRLDALRLGNLDARRDWGWAEDYVRGFWLMLQQDRADDYVLATGEARSVREFVERAAAALGFRLDWTGQGVAEEGWDRDSGRRIVAVDPAFFRTGDPDLLVGCATKARQVLGWAPDTSFEQMVEAMINYDHHLIRN